MFRAVRADLHISLTAPWLRTRRSRTRLNSWTGHIATRPHPRLPTHATRESSSTAAVRQNQAVAYSESHKGTVLSAMAASAQQMKAPEGSLAIVFSDIVQSTDIWDSKPEAMAKAMAMHDEMVRNLMVRHQGYEVKQNGDGFMIAFQTAVSALEFSLEVQHELLEVEWPEDLLKLGAASEVSAKEGEVGNDGLIFKGLRLRMSCHWGQPVCQWNEVIERMDYMGPMVNRAARFIQATEGGQIVVSEPFLQALATSKNGDSSDQDVSEGPLFAPQETAVGDDDDELGQKIDLRDLKAEHTESILRDKQFEVRLLGKRHFKGVSDEQKLYFIIPESLHGRLKFWPKHMHIEGSKGNLVG